MSMPANNLIIYISHKLESRERAMSIAGALSAFGRNRIKVHYSGQYMFGPYWRDQIERNLAEATWLILLYEGPQVEWDWCLFEMGFFRAIMKGSPTDRLLIFLHNPEHPVPPGPLESFIPVPATQKSLEALFRQIYLDEPWEISPNLFREDAEFLIQPINRIISAVRGSEKPRTHIESTLRLQKQLTIRTAQEALDLLGDRDLPPDARLIPVGSGSPMSIFGLPDEEVSWKEFLSLIANNAHRDSWNYAIARVVASSLYQIDNNQIIISNDERHIYRVILTTSTKYDDGTREFNLYFVEALQRGDFGDRSTSLLLKGLDIACRFHFMFLERSSEFSSMSVLEASPNHFRDITRRMISELNLLKRDSQDAGLGQPDVWSKFVDWSDVLEMSINWPQLELKIRQKSVEISDYKGDIDGDGLRHLQYEFAAVIKDLEMTTGPMNKKLIEQMSSKLVDLVRAETR